MNKRYLNLRRKVLVNAGFEDISVKQERKVIAWYYWLIRKLRIENRMTCAEIARATGISTNAVAVDLRRFGIAVK